jgi:chromosomal replication initiation ATPase DnaA
MTILVSGHNTAAGARRHLAAQAERTRQRKEREASANALREAKAALDRMEREVKAKAERRELARLLDEASNKVARSRGGIISARVVERRICRVFGISREQLVAEGRSLRAAHARLAVMYWCGRLTGLSMAEIGARVARDRSTVRYGVDSYVAKRAKDGRILRPIPKGKFGADWRK